MKPVLRDNDSKFLELCVQKAKLVHPDCIINVVPYYNTVKVEIQTDSVYKELILGKIRQLHYQFGLNFKATQFLQKNVCLIGFELTAL